ncbi:unnamed protein product [Sphacelaria rigidula]
MSRQLGNETVFAVKAQRYFFLYIHGVVRNFGSSRASCILVTVPEMPSPCYRFPILRMFRSRFLSGPVTRLLNLLSVPSLFCSPPFLLSLLCLSFRCIHLGYVYLVDGDHDCISRVSLNARQSINQIYAVNTGHLTLTTINL